MTGAGTMFTSFYNLAVDPFLQNPDDSFYWSNKRLDGQVETLKRAILEQRGIFLLSGAVGGGKTQLTDSLLNCLLNKIEQGYIVVSNQNKLRFFNDILASFGIEEKVISKVQFTVLFTSFLQSVQQSNKIALLVADDSQNLRQELLDELRQLTNIENNGVKLLNILLVGQPEMLSFLETARNRSLKEKIVLNDFVEPLSIKETGQYIRHRILSSGGDPEVFSKSAVAAIAEMSDGNISNINRLAQLALLDGLKQKQRRLTKENVDRTVDTSSAMQPFGERSFCENTTELYPEDGRIHVPGDTVQKSTAREPKRPKFSIPIKYLPLFGIILAVSAVAFYLLDIHQASTGLQNEALSADPVQSKNITVQELPHIISEFVQTEEDSVFQKSSSQVEIVEDDEQALNVEKEVGGVETVPVKLTADKKKKYMPFENGVLKEESTVVAGNEAEVDQELQTAPSQKSSTAEQQVFQDAVQGIPDVLNSTLILETKPSSSFITAEAETALREFIKQLGKFPGAKILVEGFIASKKNSEENILLSQERAAIVADILIKNGIREENITVIGLGNQKPLASNDTAYGRKKNRRVEVSAIQLQR